MKEVKIVQHAFLMKYAGLNLYGLSLNFIGIFQRILELGKYADKYGGYHLSQPDSTICFFKRANPPVAKRKA
jgi:hypothetical protein